MEAEVRAPGLVAVDRHAAGVGGLDHGGSVATPSCDGLVTTTSRAAGGGRAAAAIAGVDPEADLDLRGGCVG